ncbi:hypothetical protein KOW79_021523 [Hemibagrus wyckioides]|uniref:Ig-like domain-containing protein n=1 Tax=Hemibagrus wyckioides TaxID=337641 RepID=A0A9D3N6K9_9TELE|nr:uncharacterized protein LOC131347561 isoform X2 [Hemibagrus wyckioides]KAG7315435.1 hypothetical protein KOW79_021523 [Hemibagrus wyckioides]
MRIIQLQFYLLVCCGAAECFTEKSVNLGEDVTLKCEVSVKDVFWFLMKPSEPPVFILRSYSSKTVDAHYSNTTFRKRFSVQYNSSLFIHNISTKELGVYYCIQTQPASLPGISSGIRLYIQNQTAGNQSKTTDAEQPQNQTTNKSDVISPWSASLIMSVIMNCALALVVTVFIVHHCRRSPNTQTQPPGLQQQQDNSVPVYAEVQYSRTNGCVVTTNINSTYALLQAPNPELPQTEG